MKSRGMPPTLKSVELSEKRVTVNGRPVKYYVIGTGPPLVLVHGLSGSSRWWWKNVDTLARFHQVFLVDLPGFGAMRRATSGFVLGEAANWLADWIRATGLGRVNLLGHSLGGYICIRTAAINPELVENLILVSPAGFPLNKSVFGFVGPLLRAATQLRPRFARTLALDFLRAGPITNWVAARDLLGEDVREEILMVRARILFMWGGSDPLIPPGIGFLLRSTVANSRIICFEGAGHVPMIDRAEEFNENVLSFLSGDDVGE